MSKAEKPNLKAVPGGKGKVDAATLKAKELAKLAAAGDTNALGALEKIVVTFERWKKALADQKEINRKAKELEAGAEAGFENAVEAGLPTSATPGQILEKLRSVESAYSEQKDAGHEATEMRTGASEKVKAAASKLERATQDGAQMTIPGTE